MDQAILQAVDALCRKIGDIQTLISLKAQIDTVYWTKYGVLSSMMAAGLSFAALFGAILSLREARNANTISRKSSQFQTQAYVHVESAEFGLNGNVVLTVQNTGQTPATHVSVNAIAQVVRLGSVTASIAFEPDGFKTWTSLGAGCQASLSILDADRTVKQFHDLPNEREVLLISGQMIYCTVYNQDHLTQFAFYIEPGSRQRFRKPTAKLVSFHHLKPGEINARSSSVKITLDDNDPG